jgi:hypothetical protein
MTLSQEGRDFLGRLPPNEINPVFNLESLRQSPQLWKMIAVANNHELHRRLSLFPRLNILQCPKHELEPPASVDKTEVDKAKLITATRRRVGARVSRISVANNGCIAYDTDSVPIKPQPDKPLLLFLDHNKGVVHQMYRAVFNGTDDDWILQQIPDRVDGSLV